MLDYRISPIRLKGWSRLGLPAAVAILAVTPMLWAVGLFDATADPLQHALVFAVAGILLCSATPCLFGWALQGFVVRRKHAEEGDDHSAAHAAIAPAGRARAG